VLLASLGRLSFGATERLGKTVGDLMFASGGTLSRITRTNLAVCFPQKSEEDLSALVRESLRHTGRFAAEFGIVWRRGDSRWKSLITAVDGIDAIDDTRGSGRGVLVLVPHFGNWEILNLFLGERYGLTALYEPPRIASLDPIVREGRARTGSTLVPTTPGGIRALYAALKRGGVAGVLPDQVPPLAAGAYAPFFGRPALTMTLACRLAERIAPRLVLGHARRLPDASGFRLGFEALSDMERLGNSDAALTEMNSAIERLVRTDPAQYQWEYKRFKRPRSPSEKLY
jgi:KDO2-lipid IV(A) lauroyltransferase